MVKEINKNDFWREGGVFLRVAPKALRDDEPPPRDPPNSYLAVV